MFLLYGGDTERLKYALQVIHTRTSNTGLATSYLSEWAHYAQSKRWQTEIIESLCIIKANAVLRKMGFNIDDLKERFLPDNPETNLVVHPVLKALFYVCESLLPDEAASLIAKIRNENPVLNSFDYNNFNDENYLEIHMMHWLTEKVIEAGDWKAGTSARNRANHCNVRPILSWLKIEEKLVLNVKLVNVKNRFNFTSNNYVTVEPKVSSTTDNESDGLHTNFRQIHVNVDPLDCYRIRRDTAGIVLIINQRDFHVDTESVKNIKWSSEYL